MPGLELERPGLAPELVGQRRLLRILRRRPRGEVGLCVGARAEQPLLLGGPECEADRAPGLHADRLEDPRRLHDDRDARAVVGRAGARVPRVEVGARHHDLLPAVGAGDLGEHVADGSAVGVEGGRDVDLDLHLPPGVEGAGDAPVRRFGHHQPRHPAAAPGDAAAPAADHVEDAVRPGRLLHRRERSLFDEEPVARLGEIPPLARPGCPVAAEPPAGDPVGLQVGEPLLVVAAIRALLGGIARRRRAANLLRLRVDEEHLPAQLPAQRLEVRLAREPAADGGTAHGAVGADRPGERQGVERRGERCERVDARAGERPALSERDLLLIDPLEPPAAEPLLGPGGRRDVAGRAGQPRPDLLGERGEGLHHLRAAEPLLPDPGDHRMVDRLGREERQRADEEEKERDEAETAGARGEQVHGPSLPPEPGRFDYLPQRRRGPLRNPPLDGSPPRRDSLRRTAATPPAGLPPATVAGGP
ncbi:MAG: hypothetical protein BWX64_02559 [Acidobacteria bacterium ADurb.Bin051]|nr:MAG: hypothetical protein BWX64_02559 [Acidobacteria bacterium ADurb.Bin051]